MMEFFAMGGYALYVWSAWGVSAAALGGLAIWVHAERRSIQNRLERLEAEEREQN
jgi:heme exporter protein D